MIKVINISIFSRNKNKIFNHKLQILITILNLYFKMLSEGKYYLILNESFEQFFLFK